MEQRKNLLHSLLSIWNLCSVIQATILRTPCAKYADFTVFHNDKILKDVIVRTETDVSDEQCMVRCIELHNCQSYNININERICQLNSNSDRGNITKLSHAPGWLYKSTDYNDKQIGPTCKALKPCDHEVLCLDTCSVPFYECIKCDEGSLNPYCPAVNGRDYCRENPCKNGDCVSKTSGYECTCRPGFTGKNCESDIDYCFSLPCFNGGTCLDQMDKFSCTCLPGFTGQSCEIGPKSCKEFKEKLPNSTSGLYVIDGSSVGVGILTVYCDMETDEGGWTQVLNVSSKTGDLAAFEADTLHEIDDLIDFKADRKYGMKSSALKQLRKLTGYNQFRFKCKILDTTTKLVHIKTTLNNKGLDVTECLTVSNSTTEVILPACDTFTRVSDDISEIGQYCQNWQWRNKIGKDRWLIDHTMFIYGNVHWIIGHGQRYDCDSHREGKTVKIVNGDFWEVYVK